MSMYCECELKNLNIDEILSGIRYIDPEDLVVLYQEKIRRLGAALRKTDEDNANLVKENKRLKESVEKLDREKKEVEKSTIAAIEFNVEIANSRLKDAEKTIDRLRADLEESHANSMEWAAYANSLSAKLSLADIKFGNGIYGKDSAEWNELIVENRRLLEKQASLETQINVLNTVSDGYKDKIDELTQENEKLEHTKKTLWKHWCAMKNSRNEYHHWYKQLMAENKSLHILNHDLEDRNAKLTQELEELKAGVFQSMSIELGTIFAECADLQTKIDEFRKNHPMK